MTVFSVSADFLRVHMKTIKDLAVERRIDGSSTAQIADFLKVSQRTIQRWVKKGKMVLSEKFSRVKSRKLTPEQEDEVLAFVDGNAGIFLDEVKDFIAETHGTAISTSTASRLLAKHEYTRKRGTRVNVKYKTEKGMRFLEDIRPIFENNPIMFASLDEMSVMLNLAPTYGYARKGRRAVIPQPGKRTAAYMVTLCISPVGVLFWNLRTGSINAETFVEVLKRLPDGITLMLDNAPVHHANKCLWERGLKSVAEIADEKAIVFKFIPSYAPHLNPVEYTFNLVRNLLRRKQAWTEEKLIAALAELFQTESFSQGAMTKLFASVIRGGPNPGDRLKSS